jgi:transposase
VQVENIVIETLNIKDHKISSCFWEGNIVVTFEAKRLRLLPCSKCGKRAHRHDRLPERTWIHVPLWGIATLLLYRPWRVRCSTCGIKREQIPWAVGKKRVTTALVVTVATWVRLLPVEAVSRLFGLHWNTVYAAVREAVDYGVAHRKVGTVLHIGVDEISRKKGHRYLTQVYDLDRGTLLWSGDGRKAAALEQFFESGVIDLSTITAVCCDMWKPYIQVVGRYLPHVAIVFDKFHIIRHLLEAVDKVRIEEAQEMKKTHPELLAKTKYVILKNEENLTEKQSLRLKDLQRLNLKSTRAWLLKESFRELWRCTTEEDARECLKQWCWMAAHSRLEPIIKVVAMIRKHLEGIVAFFRHRITNGMVEALNNTAKAISHRARGYRTPKVFINIMMLCMGGLDMPELYHEFV